MSYILEALRKAEAERGRGSVPDLHAQLLPVNGPAAAMAVPRSPAMLWTGIGALVVAAAAAAAAWYVARRHEPAAVALAPPLTAAPVPAGVAPQVAAPERDAPTAAPVQVAAMPVPPALPAAPVAPEPEPVMPPPRPIAKPKPRPAATPKALAPPPKPAEAASKAEATPPPARVPALAELSGDLRQQVPQLVIGGSVYSPQASARMVVINGQVFQEGSSLAPELRLEQIRPKTAVFSIRGQRFELPL